MDFLINNLTRLLNERDGNPHNYWRIGTSDGTTPRNRWELMREGNCVAIGWDIGDLTEITYDKKGKEQIFQLRLDQLITGERKIKNERERVAFARWLAFGGD